MIGFIQDILDRVIWKSVLSGDKHEICLYIKLSHKFSTFLPIAAVVAELAI